MSALTSVSSGPSLQRRSGLSDSPPSGPEDLVSHRPHSVDIGR